MNKIENIAICARSEIRFFVLDVAKEIKARKSTRLHFYCSGAQEFEFYTKLNSKDQIFDSITDSRTILSRAFDEGLNWDDVMERAERLEALTGITINRMIVPDRHFGRGYVLGGYNHPRSRYSEEVDYLHAVHAYCAALEFWEEQIRDRNISLVLNGSREAYHMARSLGIHYRVLCGSRYKNLHYWAWNPYFESPLFEARYHETSESPEISLTTPYHSHLALRKNYDRRFRFGYFIKSAGMLIARQVYWRVRGYEKAKGYYLSENLRFLFRVWREYRRLRALPLKTLKDLEGNRFVYFPLHIEPETALHGLSPEYFYQHALIAAVARDLPAGVTLAVKEHYGVIGRRTDEFYRQILDLKNVVMLDPWEVGIQCAQNADVVVTICGTAGLEAIAGGTPVIAFGHHNLYNFLPSVKVVSDERRLKGYLADALSGKMDKVEIQDQAKRLIASIAAYSFDMEDYDYINLEKFTANAVTAAVDSLDTSLNAGPDVHDPADPAFHEAHAEEAMSA